jgi:hypothetical protein
MSASDADLDLRSYEALLALSLGASVPGEVCDLLSARGLVSIDLAGLATVSEAGEAYLRAVAEAAILVPNEWLSAIGGTARR